MPTMTFQPPAVVHLVVYETQIFHIQNSTRSYYYCFSISVFYALALRLLFQPNTLNISNGKSLLSMVNLKCQQARSTPPGCAETVPTTSPLPDEEHLD